MPQDLSTLEQAIVLIREDVKTFRFYESQHRAKNTPESLVKAEVNAKLAKAREAFLSEQG